VVNRIDPSPSLRIPWLFIFQLDESWRQTCEKVFRDDVDDFNTFNDPAYEAQVTTVCSGGTVVEPGNTKGGSITVPLTSCLTGLE